MKHFHSLFLFFLTEKWDSQDEDIQTKYDKLFEGSITQEEKYVIFQNFVPELLFYLFNEEN